MLRLRSGGAIEPVQERTFDMPTALRVLDDDTIVMTQEGPDAYGPATLLVQPPDGPSFTTRVSPFETAFDGLDAARVWYVEWDLGSGEYVLCHALPEGPDCVDASRVHRLRRHHREDRHRRRHARLGGRSAPHRPALSGLASAPRARFGRRRRVGRCFAPFVATGSRGIVSTA